MPHSNNDMLHDVHNYGCYTNTREIFLHNHHAFDENPGVEYKMSNIFIKNLRSLEVESHDEITVHMHSIGGEWADGMAMFDGIKMCHSKVSIIAYGQAESMSSIILQAATRRLLTPRSYFMVHNGMSGISGEYRNVQNWINFEKKIFNQMLDIYAERCCRGKFFKEKGYDQDKTKKYFIKKFKDGDWYMEPEEAVYYGFADRVVNKW